jgi:hypothetical protein
MERIIFALQLSEQTLIEAGWGGVLSDGVFVHLGLEVESGD